MIIKKLFKTIVIICSLVFIYTFIYSIITSFNLFNLQYNQLYTNVYSSIITFVLYIWKTIWSSILHIKNVLKKNIIPTNLYTIDEQKLIIAKTISWKEEPVSTTLQTEENLANKYETVIQLLKKHIIYFHNIATN